MSELFAGSRYDCDLPDLVDNDSSYDTEEEKEYSREEDTVNCNVSVASGGDVQSALVMAVFDVKRNRGSRSRYDCDLPDLVDNDSLMITRRRRSMAVRSPQSIATYRLLQVVMYSLHKG